MPAWLRRYEWPIFAVSLVALLIGVSAFWQSREEPPDLVFRDGSALASGTPIRVHVTGAVTKPGVYELREGDRLIDAVAAAGGPIDAADLDALNLARRVRDEEQVLVPRRGASGGGSAGGGSPRVEPLGPGARLDINTATEAQLDQLPGIGEAYSRRIVDSRKVDGPYRNTQDLVDRKVLPRATYERIRDLLTVSSP